MDLTDGRQARAARALLGMTQETLAAVAGVHLNSVYRLETRQGLHRRCLSAGRVAKALAPFGITFESRPDALAVVYSPGPGQGSDTGGGYG